MSESISKGYLISLNDFEEHDHILNFIFSDDKIIGMISKGSRKLLSKNGRNLIMSSLFEVEFFKSRSIDKLSRLKKIKPIQVVNLLESQNETILFINNYLMKNKIRSFPFEHYQIIAQSSIIYEPLTSLIICLKYLLNFEGLKLILNKCALCNQAKIYSLSFLNKGFLCFNCFQLVDEIKTSKEFNESLHFLDQILISKIVLFSNEIKWKIAKFLAMYIYEFNGTYCDLNNFSKHTNGTIWY